MTRQIFILIVIASCACTAAQSSSAATIPAGTTLTVQTDSLISSKEAVGRTFAAKIAQDVAVKGKVLLKAGTEAFGRVQASRAKTYKSEPLSLELTSISVNGRKIGVKTNSVQPEGGPTTSRQARYGHTAGTLVVNPGSKMQFQLAQSVNL